MIAPSYEQNTAKLGEIHGTVNLTFKRPVHEGYKNLMGADASHRATLHAEILLHNRICGGLGPPNCLLDGVSPHASSVGSNIPRFRLFCALFMQIDKLFVSSLSRELDSVVESQRCLVVQPQEDCRGSRDPPDHPACKATKDTPLQGKMHVRAIDAPKEEGVLEVPPYLSQNTALCIHQP